MQKYILLVVTISLTNIYATAQSSFRPTPQLNAHASNIRFLPKQLCKIITAPRDQFNIEKYFASNGAYLKIMKVINQIRNNGQSCSITKEHFYHFPLNLIKYQISDGTPLHIQFRYNKKYEIEDLYAADFLKSDLNVVEHQVRMRDNIKLSTYAYVHVDKKPRGTILIRTPYRDDFVWSFYEAYLADKGYHVVLQSNRGTSRSQGDFKWLSKQNIYDGHDTINWIIKQPFSNGKVIVYGGSYDGFNALAAAINAPAALKGVVAISSPANAFTDSFSYNGVSETRLLNYIWERETNDSIENFKEKINDLRKRKVARIEWDNELYKRDVADWEEYVTNGKTYWKNRNLVPFLANISVPVIHIAGLNRDQDARDVLLSYKSIQKAAPSNTNHRLYLHGEGHGPGGWQRTTELDQYLSLASDNPQDIIGAKVRQFSQEQGVFLEGDEYPLPQISKVDFLFPQSNELLKPLKSSNHYDLIATLKDYSDFSLNAASVATFKFDLNNISFLNGSPSINLKLSSSAPQTLVYVDLFKQTDDGELIDLVRPPQRAVIVTSTIPGVIQKAKIDISPTFLKVSQDEKLIVKLSTWNPAYISSRFKKRRLYFTLFEEAEVRVFEGSRLMLPIE